MNIFQTFFKLRYMLFLFLLLIALPTLSFFLLNLTVHGINKNVNNEISNSVQAAAFEHRGWVERTGQFLELLSKVAEVKSGDEKACSKFMVSMLELYPRYVNIALVGTDGIPLCSALPFDSRFNTNYWLEQTLKNKTFSVGEYQIGTSLQKPALSFGYPILDQKGDVKYVLYAGLDLAWINELIKQIDLPPQSTVQVVDQNGIILARVPDEEYARKFIPEPLLIQKVLIDKTGTSDSYGVDGIKRIYAFTSLNNAFIIIGIPYSYVYMQAFEISLPYLIVFLMTLLLLLAIFWKRGNIENIRL